MERAKINLKKKNYVDKNINERKRVDETFGFEGCLVVNVVFSPVDIEEQSNNRSSNKLNYCLIGSVILTKNEKSRNSNSFKIQIISEKNIRF